MPKIARDGQDAPRVNVAVAVPVPAAVATAAVMINPGLPKPESAVSRYEHEDSDHHTTPNGSLFCSCVCDRCWPPEGGPCPDERGPSC